MLSDEERTRWGQLQTRIDLSAEEKEELKTLRQRHYEDVFGKSDADFDALEDAGGGQIIPMSQRAQQQLTGTAVPRDPVQFDTYVKQLEKEGYTVRRLKAS